MRSLFLAILGLLLLFPSAATAVEKGLTVNGVRYFSYPAFTRIVLELEAAGAYTVNRSTDGRAVVLAAYEGPLVLKTPLPAVRDSAVSGLESREDAGRQVIMISLDPSAREVKDFVLRSPDRIVLDVEKGAQAAPPAAAALNRQVVVMLDPGHGGKDTGIVTARGQEKTVTLETAHAVKRLLQKDPRFKVVMTRERDVYVTLDERAAAANAAGARLFISIHAGVSGAQFFIQDPDEALQGQGQQPLARDFLGFETGNEQQEHRWGSQQAGHARESGVLGRMFARQFAGNNTAEPVQAPIALLRPVDAAAVVVEIGPELNPAVIAESIAGGIEAYARESR
jgi:N-acetylmuramoyl-L-alanine amidase